MFSHASQIDASRSQFSNVGRDQHVFYQTILADKVSQEIINQALHNFCPNGRELPSPSSTAVITQYTPHHNQRTCEEACNLIVEITRLLVDSTKFPNEYRYPQRLSLKTLHETLVLTGLAIQVYENTPLARNLNHSIGPDIQKCHDILQDMLDTIDSYRQRLYLTSIYSLWPRVLWSGSEVQKLAWRLSALQFSLGQFLVALNS